MSNNQQLIGLARKAYTPEDWNYHIKRVLFYARRLRQHYRADWNIIELAVYLHDITRSKEDAENHHLTGARAAENILRRYRYPKEIIRDVKNCILSHRSQTGLKPTTIEQKILANADAMAHFDIVPLFFHWRAHKNTLEETRTWLVAKLRRDWEKKLTLPLAKKLVAEKYRAAKLLLKEVK